MNRDTAVSTWRDVCGSDTVMAMGVVTGRMLEEFATRVEAAERERCAMVCESLPAPSEYGPSDASHFDAATIACADAIRAKA